MHYFSLSIYDNQRQDRLIESGAFIIICRSAEFKIMNTTLQQLYNLNSPDGITRRTGQTYFESLRLQPEHFIREVTGILQTTT
jgi:hypothetical protein